MAAIAAADAGARVAVLERQARPGVKLLSTGGGRCNLTNTLPAEAFMAAFGRQGRFMQDALKALDSAGLRRFFERLGLHPVSDEPPFVFAGEGGARAVLDALLAEVRRLGVELLTGRDVTAIAARDGAVTGARTAAGGFAAPRVVLAAGGRGYPALGGTDAGYRLAAAMGHTVIAPVPANVPLVTAEPWPGALAGVTLPDVALRLTGKGAGRTGWRGALLFTHRGLSGPVALDASGDVARLLPAGGPVAVELDFAPAAPPANEWIGRWRAEHPRRTAAAMLREFVPASLAAALCAVAEVAPDTSGARARREQAERLAAVLRGCPLRVAATEGFEKAMVTRGGVSLKEIAPATLESRLAKGLYFAGEVADLDGPCGGYNLQWAFSSGWLAGVAATGRKRT